MSITLNIQDRVYFKSELLDGEQTIVHGFTSKKGGFSHGRIEGLNLGFRVGDNTDDVKRNYTLVADDLGLVCDNITAAKQIHSADIRIVTEYEKGCGVSRADELFEADGLITTCKNIPICVFYADCVPILLADSHAGVIAAVHSGWRGTVQKIVGRATDIMCRQFGASPDNIKAAIGPSVGKCCFETGNEVAEEFDADLVSVAPNDKYMVDLWEANRRILTTHGVAEQNIDVMELCTICHKDVFYSYRAQGTSTGRMGAFIMMK